MTIAEVLRQAITQSDQTLTEIAQQTGIPQPGLWKFMQGFDIRLKTAQRLADYFGFKIIPPAKIPKRMDSKVRYGPQSNTTSQARDDVRRANLSGGPGSPR